MQLANLPREILDMVIFYIRDNRISLLHLALTCHALHELTVPTLYSFFEAQHMQFHLGELMRTLVEKPARQKHLRYAYLLRWDDLKAPVTLKHQDIADICDEVKRQYPESVPILSTVFDRAMQKDLASLTLLFLYLVPNLKNLTIYWRGRIEDEFFARLLLSNRLGPRFENLKTLYIANSQVESCTFLAGMMRLPSLEELQLAAHFNGCPRGPPFGDWTPSFKAPWKLEPVSNLRVMYLAATDILVYPSEFVAALVALCKNLEYFKYRREWPPRIRPGKAMDWFAILKPVRHSLRGVYITDETASLKLDGQPDFSAEGEFRIISGGQSSFPRASFPDVWFLTPENFQCPLSIVL